MATKRPDRAWIGAGAVASVVIVAAGWFFFLSPQLDATAESEQQLADAQVQNIVLQQRVTALRNDAAHTADIQAQLDAARAAVPAEHDIAGFTRQLTDQAATAGVTLSSITPGEPVELVTATPSEPAPPADDDGETPNEDSTTTDGAPTGTAATNTTPPVADGPAGKLYTIEVTVQTDGPLAAQRAFLSALERDGDRRPLVTSATMQPSVETVATEDEVTPKKKGKDDGDDEVAADVTWSMTTQMQIFVAPQAPAEDSDTSSNSN